jgi:hypothetical protein
VRRLPALVLFAVGMLAVVPLYVPWRLLGFEPDTSFQLWMLCVLALNFVAAQALFRRALAFEPLPAAAGAFIVAFGSSRWAASRGLTEEQVCWIAPPR